MEIRHNNPEGWGVLNKPPEILRIKETNISDKPVELLSELFVNDELVVQFTDKSCTQYENVEGE